MMDGNVIISYGVGGGENIYSKLLDRLAVSCNQYNVPFIGWEKLPSNARSHHVSPYGFKVHVIKDAIAKGFKQVVWADSAVFLKKSPELFFQMVAEKGLVVLGHGDKLGPWVNDKSLIKFGFTREEVKEKWLLSGTIFGIDADSEEAQQFINELCEYEQADWFCEDGQKPSSDFHQHRHDEAIMSLLVLKNQNAVQNAYLHINGQTDSVTFRSNKDMR